MDKTIILCFDGTCNDPEDSVQTVRPTGEVEDDSITNVLKLHLLFGGTLRSKVEATEQISLYYSGVGTNGSIFQRLRNSILAPPGEDVGAIIKRAIRDLYRYHAPGDRLVLFGFSRGAAIARRLAAVLQYTFPALNREPPAIRFMGLFDTVAAIGRPNLLRKGVEPASDVVFENRSISPLVVEALHLVALDERRIAFMPTLMNQDARVTEIWFPGAHADVGGGFYYDGLSDLALQFMLGELERRDLGLRILQTGEIGYADLFDNHQDRRIEERDLIIQPNHLGKSHQQEGTKLIKREFLDDRCPHVRVNDKTSVYPPLIHHSVCDRMVDDPGYDPVPLRQKMVNEYTGTAVSFRVWYGPGREDGTGYDNLADAKLAAVHHPQPLAPGEQRTFPVQASLRFTSSRILVRAGETYRFEIDDRQRWFDGGITASPRGWLPAEEQALPWYQQQLIRTQECKRRHPNAEWFEVLGTVNRDDGTLFRPLEHLAHGWEPRESGELYCFPNDLLERYGNNLGSIQVTIIRVG